METIDKYNQPSSGARAMRGSGAQRLHRGKQCVCVVSALTRVVRVVPRGPWPCPWSTSPRWYAPSVPTEQKNFCPHNIWVRSKICAGHERTTYETTIIIERIVVITVQPCNNLQVFSFYMYIIKQYISRGLRWDRKHTGLDPHAGAKPFTSLAI